MPTSRDLGNRVLRTLKTINTTIAGTGTFLTTPGIDTSDAASLIAVFQTFSLGTGSISFKYQESDTAATSYTAISSSRIYESATTLTSGSPTAVRYATIQPTKKYVRVGLRADATVAATGVSGTLIAFES